MNPVRQFADLGDRVAGLLEGRLKQLTGAHRVAVELLIGELQVDESGDQALLGAVVKIPRQTLARAVGGGDDPRARGDHVRA